MAVAMAMDGLASNGSRELWSTVITRLLVEKHRFYTLIPLTRLCASMDAARTLLQEAERQRIWQRACWMRRDRDEDNLGRRRNIEAPMSGSSSPNTEIVWIKGS